GALDLLPDPFGAGGHPRCAARRGPAPGRCSGNGDGGRALRRPRRRLRARACRRSPGGGGRGGARPPGWRGRGGGAGPRGGADGAAMTARGASAARMTAAVGPCIGPASYEVGLEFLDAFVAADPANARFFAPGVSAQKRLFDLPAFVLSRLAAAGVAEAEWI